MNFIEELKASRIKKNISLEEISSRTRINIRFLEAIEQGRLDVLPTAYVKSFLRQFARSVDVDEEKVIEEFSGYKSLHRENKNEISRAVSHSSVKNPSISNLLSSPANSRKFMQVSLAIAAMGVLLIIVYLGVQMRGENVEMVEERPFREVVREMEQNGLALTPFQIEPPTPSLPLQKPDSLFLTATTRDTVWVTILIDNIKQNEYIIPPDHRREWRAANEFLITIGNAGGISLILNDEDLGVLGREGEVVRNLRITGDGIER